MTLILETSRPEEGRFTLCSPDNRCEACKLVNFSFSEPSKLKMGRIHNYSYKPRWKPKEVVNDPFSYYLGVELETDSYSSNGVRDIYGREASRRDSIVNKRVAADMRLPKQLWIPKSDISVTGPEFVSQPATLAYWTKQKPKLAEMFKMLLHAGYRSHDNDNAGMHINISKTAFDDANHLYRFLTLIHFSPVWSRRMAQRTQSSMEHWAGVGLDRRTRRQLAKWAMADPETNFRYLTDSEWVPARYNGDGTRVRGTGVYRRGELNPNYVERPQVERYTALNIPAGEARFEFRLPRGTLRIDRFFKNLQWVTAMVEYTRGADVLASRPKAFMDWTMMRRHQYPELAGFLMERAPKLARAA